MSAIELKVGEWYETRNGRRVKVIADVREHCTPAVTQTASGKDGE